MRFIIDTDARMQRGAFAPFYFARRKKQMRPFDLTQWTVGGVWVVDLSEGHVYTGELPWLAWWCGVVVVGNDSCAGCVSKCAL